MHGIVTAHGDGVGRDGADEVLIPGRRPGHDNVLVWGVDRAGKGSGAAAGESGFGAGGGGQTVVGKLRGHTAVVRDVAEDRVGAGGIVKLESGAKAGTDRDAIAAAELDAAVPRH